MVAVGLICFAAALDVLNFPIGPAHNADTWRSNARLGVGCFGAQAWSSKIPYPGRYVILLTRCTDTSAPLTSLSLCALAIIKQPMKGHGLECWRRLCREYEPDSSARFTSMLGGILEPRWEGLQLLQFVDALHVFWEHSLVIVW